MSDIRRKNNYVNDSVLDIVPTFSVPAVPSVR